MDWWEAAGTSGRPGRLRGRVPGPRLANGQPASPLQSSRLAAETWLSIGHSGAPPGARGFPAPAWRQIPGKPAERLLLNWTPGAAVTGQAGQTLLLCVVLVHLSGTWSS